MTPRSVVRLVCLGHPDAPGPRTPYDGQWLVEYDPTRPGVDPHGEPMRAHLVTTADRSQARVFHTAQELTECLFQATGGPGPQGRPDRPIMAYTLATEPFEPEPSWTR